MKIKMHPKIITVTNKHKRLAFPHKKNQNLHILSQFAQNKLTAIFITNEKKNKEKYHGRQSKIPIIIS